MNSAKILNQVFPCICCCCYVSRDEFFSTLQRDNFVRFLIYRKKSKIWAQPHLCSSNTLEMASKRTEVFIFEFSRKIAQRVWDKVTSDYLEQLYELLPRPMAAVVLAEGGHTKYWLTQNTDWLKNIVTMLFDQWINFFLSCLLTFFLDSTSA